MKYHAIFLLLFIAWTDVFAVEFSVKSFRKLENDMSARIDARKEDQNGDPCAIIKVVTTQTDFDWEPDGLGIMAAIPKKGEYWLYIPFGAKRITIKHSQLGVLRDYVYPLPIEKATVYEMVLSTDEVVVQVKKRAIVSQWLLINSDPPGADVYINDVASGKTPFQSELEVGKYTWRLSKELYEPRAGVVDLKAGNDMKQKLELKLSPNFGTIRVTSTPESGAAVFLNGVPTGKTTPCSLDTIPASTCTLTVSRDMYVATPQKITLAGAEVKDLNFALTPTFSEVNVTTDPIADIYVNDEFKGSQKWSGRLLRGIYTFEARLDKYITASEKQSIVVGEPVNILLKPVPRTGNLKIMSTPFEANILLDNQSVGQSPFSANDLLIGTHQVELSLPDYSTYRTSVEVKEGETAVVNAMLVSNKPIVKQAIPISTYTPNVSDSKKEKNVVVRDINEKKEKSNFLLVGGLSAILTEKTGSVMMGSVRKVGMYVKGKSNLNFDNTFDIEGLSTTQRYFSDRVEIGRMALTGGMLFRLSRAAILNVGAGYGNRWVNWETLGGEKFQVTDYSYTGLETEIGLTFKLGFLLFNGGISANSFNHPEADFGVGLCF
jgi:hypothetical protein